jgi:hypothetical protein
MKTITIIFLSLLTTVVFAQENQSDKTEEIEVQVEEGISVNEESKTKNELLSAGKANLTKSLSFGKKIIHKSVNRIKTTKQRVAKYRMKTLAGNNLGMKIWLLSLIVIVTLLLIVVIVTLSSSDYGLFLLGILGAAILIGILAYLLITLLKSLGNGGSDKRKQRKWERKKAKNERKNPTN